jgi:hypothetical protein
VKRPPIEPGLWRTFREIADWERSLDEGELRGDLIEKRSGLMFGLYSEQGLLRVLERYGTLARLSAKGLGNIDVRLSLEDPFVPRITLVSERYRRPAIELTLSRTEGRKLGLASLAQTPLLFLDGIVLEHPGREFDWARPPLPGQRRPGLSVSNDVLELLLLMAGRIGAQGMALVPRHFHAAHAFARHFAFADGATQGRFEALRFAARLRPLWLLAWALELDCVRNANGALVRWTPSPMISPLTEALANRLSSNDWERARRAARGERYFLDRDRLRERFPWSRMPPGKVPEGVRRTLAPARDRVERLA